MPSKPAVIPPACGLAVLHVTFTGVGTELAYWNRCVAVAEMGGQGTVVEPRLNLNLSNGSEDCVSSQLPALQAHQLSLADPAAPAGSFDAAAAARGKLEFEGAGTGATWHRVDAHTQLTGRRITAQENSGASGAAAARAQRTQSTSCPAGRARAAPRPWPRRRA